MTAAVVLPILVAGRRVEQSDSTHIFDYSGRQICLPAIDLRDAGAMLGKGGSRLANVSIDDVVLFLDRVAKNWHDPANKWRQLAIEWSAFTTGYARSTIEWDINFIAGVLQRHKLYDLIDNDLGDAGLLDEFTRHKAVYRRCFPLGKLLNILVGNLPLTSFISIVRSLATKNETICKLPSRDVVSGLSFANCIFDTDPDHPVVAALSCCYWPADSAVNERMLEEADGVVVWGKGETISQIRRSTPSETPIIEYGPKRSLSIIDLTQVPADRFEACARRLVYDVCSYDQEACFSVQQLFCIGPSSSTKDFVGEIRRAFEAYACSLPARTLTLDERYHVVRARADGAVREEVVHRPAGADEAWMIIETSSPREVVDHPLGRTLYVHSTASIDEVLPWIDDSVQTVSFEPYERLEAVVTKIAAAGAQRIVRSGRHGRFRPGISHDGFYGMSRLVRWVSWERDIDYKFRFMSSSVSDDEQRIYYQLATKAE